MGFARYISMPLIQLGGHRQGMRYIEPVFAEIDEDDYERVSNYNWSQNNQSNRNTIYARTREGNHWLHLHRFIMGLEEYNKDKRVINHIDGNGLNNKKENLEICDSLYNSQSIRRRGNQGLVYLDTSGKRIKKWRASIVLFKKKYTQRFETQEEAQAYIDEIIRTSSNGTCQSAQ